MFCRFCGKELGTDVTRCTNCGKEQGKLPEGNEEIRTEKRVPEKKVKWRWACLILVCAAVVCGIGFYVIGKFGTSNEQQTVQTEANRVAENNTQGSVEDETVEEQTTTETTSPECLFSVKTYNEVTDLEGNTSHSLIDADVLLYDEDDQLVTQLVTDEEGVYSSLVTPGKYHLVVKSDRFVTYEETITLSDQEENKEIVLERYRLQGVVSAEDQENIPEGTAEIYSGDELEATVKLDSDGHFTYECDPGIYTLVVKAEGYEEHTEEIIVGEEREYECAVMLKNDPNAVVDITSYIHNEDFDVSNFFDQIGITDYQMDIVQTSDGKIRTYMYDSDDIVFRIMDHDKYRDEWQIANYLEKKYSLFGVALGDTYEDAIEKLYSSGAVEILNDETDSEWVSIKFVARAFEDMQLSIYIKRKDGIVIGWDAANFEEGEGAYVYSVLMLEASVDTDTWEDWRQAYFDIVKKKFTISQPKFPYVTKIVYKYILEDIDGDTIPELIETEYYDTYFLSAIYTWKDGAVDTFNCDNAEVSVVSNDIISVSRWRI
jgi:hypothetical protein